MRLSKEKIPNAYYMFESVLSLAINSQDHNRSLIPQVLLYVSFPTVRLAPATPEIALVVHYRQWYDISLCC